PARSLPSRRLVDWPPCRGGTEFPRAPPVPAVPAAHRQALARPRAHQAQPEKRAVGEIRFAAWLERCLKGVGAGTKTGLSLFIVPPPRRISNRAIEDSLAWRPSRADSDRPSSPIFAEAQFAFFALIFLGGQAGFPTFLTASAVSGAGPHKQARRGSWPLRAAFSSPSF